MATTCQTVGGRSAVWDYPPKVTKQGALNCERLSRGHVSGVQSLCWQQKSWMLLVWLSWHFAEFEPTQPGSFGFGWLLNQWVGGSRNSHLDSSWLALELRSYLTARSTITEDCQISLLWDHNQNPGTKDQTWWIWWRRCDRFRIVRTPREWHGQ